MVWRGGGKERYGQASMANGFKTEWKGERKYYCKNSAPALIDCLFYRLKHFSEFDSETAACSYIYSSCRTQQFRFLRLSIPSVYSTLFVPSHCLQPSLRQHFVVFFSLLYPDVADVEGRCEKLLTAREFSCSADVSNWSCFFTPFIFFLVESLCAHNLHPSFTADNVCRCLSSSFENKIPSKLWTIRIYTITE